MSCKENIVLIRGIFVPLFGTGTVSLDSERWYKSPPDERTSLDPIPSVSQWASSV